jgi:SAM-dependent methyltransferase
MERLAAWVLEKRGEEIEKQLGEAKRRWLSPVRGRVLELGPGLGTNFPYLEGTEWTGVEPSGLLREKLTARGTPGPLLEGAAEAIPFPNESFDAVVTTLVLCSVREPAKAVAEIRRVLKPGGAYTFIEHVAADTFGKRCLQQMLRPCCCLLGCHPMRRTGETIARGGFSRVDQVNWPVPGMSLLPHIAGRALA